MRPHRLDSELLVLLSLLLFSACWAKVNTGTYYDNTRWKYLEKFCFDEDGTVV